MIDSTKLASAQNDRVRAWHDGEPLPETAASLEEYALLLHSFNYRLWHLEDRARDPGASDHEIALVKRAIDKNNQSRNDCIERLDELILAAAGPLAPRAAGAALHSETAGAITDRLSINSLKIHHMREQAERTDATREHRARCEARLAILGEQRSDLISCLGNLLAGTANGTLYFKVYRQMKMYNDPSLNPAIYGRST
ncbi:MAG: hypothetical protein A2583_14460 [Bdellovibrionales bacterium RIFOXYD1_FULL_53_11]|nr:MAG: hypothetical protein A2583_14460 [Bdellovibrionales bacterium RIFOXYD1_FULL_53_11]